jgi:hypothetical protein
VSFVGVASSGEETKKTSNEFSPFSPSENIHANKKYPHQDKLIANPNQYDFDIALKPFE